jgi:hypothetical protein
LDPLVKDFFQNPFPGFKSDIIVKDNVLETNIPVVELPLNIDINELLTLVKQIPINPVVRKVYPYEKFPRIQGWQQSIIWNDGTLSVIMDDVYYKKPAAPIPEIIPDTIGTTIKQVFFDLGFTVNLCAVSILDPKGYIRPHRDINVLDYPLGYFWLPLNNPLDAELKIYPYGTVDITLGNLYLLNQKSFTHAVINNSNERRYVIIGWVSKISNLLEQTIKENIKLQY